MIGQHAPRKSVVGMGGEHSQQVAGKSVHALRALADVMMVLVTRRRDEKARVAEVWPVRWRMPRMAVVLSPREQFLALLLIELTPEIARFGHGERLTGPHKCGTPNLPGSEFRLQPGWVWSFPFTRCLPLPPEGGTPSVRSSGFSRCCAAGTEAKAVLSRRSRTKAEVKRRRKRSTMERGGHKTGGME
jgi:hypothetical protein